MLFSVVMQSTLKDYIGAAKNRAEKLRRAISSVLMQTFQDFELIVVADRCDETFTIAKEFVNQRLTVHYSTWENTQTKWSAHCRNVGIDLAKGMYILYIDNDDMFESTYLQRLANEIKRTYADFYITSHYEIVKNELKPCSTFIGHGGAGTANIIHKRKINTRWQRECFYGMEDYRFIKGLLNETKDYKEIFISGYIIMHKNGCYDY